MAGKDAQVVVGVFAPTGINFSMGSCQKKEDLSCWKQQIRGVWESLDFRGLGSPSRSQAQQLGSVGLFWSQGTGRGAALDTRDIWGF